MSRKTLRRSGTVAGALLGLAGMTASPGMAAPTCAAPSLAALHVAGMKIESAAPVAAAGTDPAYCDVKGSVRTSGEGAGPNQAGFEIRLPADWTGRFVFFGVGGLAGSLQPSANAVDVGEALAKGYATAITDTGHHGANPFDAAWILNAPGKPNAARVADYWYRSAHEVTIAAKALVTRYYAGRAIAHAYFDGCSFGGHMGLMEAMRFPTDYDGVVAGAPYMDNRTQIWGYKNAKAFLNAYVPPAVVAKVADAVLAGCDAADGVTDGLIQNPAKCAFDPQTLVPGTLTQAQADAFKLFIRATEDAHGRVIYPGSPLGDLASTDGPAGGFIGWVESKPPADPAAANPWAGGMPPVLWAAAAGFIDNFDMHNATFDLNHDWPETDGRITDAGLSQFDARTAVGNVDQPRRLERFLAAGRKLILYHGYADPAISPYRTVRFYEELAAWKGGYDKAAAEARLFMVPDMLHCGGGSGPNSFDTLTALQQWVEQGHAPDAILATRFADENPAGRTLRTMPLCPFPAQARYAGTGDVNAASNWTCPAGDRSQLEVGADGIAAGMGPAAAH